LNGEGSECEGQGARKSAKRRRVTQEVVRHKCESKVKSGGKVQIMASRRSDVRSIGRRA